jgi:hypothetical protein
MIKQVFLYVLLFQFTSNAQGILAISGQITDADSEVFLTEVVIDIPYGGYGSSSNLEGQFIFQIPRLVMDSVVVTFSKIGYESQSIEAVKLSEQSFNEIKLYKAKPIEIKLGLSDARTLVEAAVDSIKCNYISASFFQNGFYQEGALIKEIGYVKIKESQLRVERYPEEKEVDRIKVLKSRYVNWSGQSDKIEAWQLGNGAAIASRSIETELPDFLNKKSLRNYEFKVDSVMVSFHNLELYVVNFEPKSNGLRGGRFGKIYIEPESRAIVRIEYELTPKGLSDVIFGGTSGVKLKGESLKYVSQYRFSDDKWVLHQNTAWVSLNYKEKLDRQFSVDAIWYLTFLATETRKLEVRMIKETDVLGSTETFRRTNSLGNSFWDSQSFLAPTAEMQLITVNLRKR